MLLLQNISEKIRKKGYKKYRYNITRVVDLRPKNLKKEKL